MSETKGRFVVLEGADGCGKSTQASRLAAALRADGRVVRHVRDPGSTHLAEQIRGVLLEVRVGDGSSDGISPRAETYLYLAARAQLAEEVLRPALDAGEIVVCERWTLSTEIYQGLAGGIGADEVRRIGRLAEAGVTPDVVVVLDVAEGQGLARLDGEPDRMESKGDAFHDLVVRGYRELAAGRPGHVLVESAGPDAVAARVLSEVRRRLA